MSTNFFSKINYSAANEDSNSERGFLSIKGHDRVLCITGSGARPLDLLVDSPESVLTIDFNPTQSSLCELKVAAYKELEYEEFCAFIGLSPSTTSKRKATYKALKMHLSAATRQFWDLHESEVEKGILYCGTWEAFMQVMAKFAGVRSKTLVRLFSCDDVHEQYQIWKNEWNDIIWKSSLWIFSKRFVWKYLLKEPGIDYVPKTMNIFWYMHDRFEHCAKNFLFKNNPYARLLLWGRYHRESLPLHLRQEHYSTIKNQLGALKIQTGSLLDLLHQDKMKQHFSAFSLSDFSSYADPELYQNIWDGVIKASQDGARACERQFLVKYDPRELFPLRLHRDVDIEEKLMEQDDTFIYSFVCATVRKTLQKC
ncbi:MAG: DUF3419 family protein [Oligoflexales bacterium]|nr:DUF3419 family protein [Oligoflexales bacterium]